MKTLIIIPTYNERENIPELLSGLMALSLVSDILFIDDNSPDETAELIKDYQLSNPHLHLIERPAKLGLASAYLTAFSWALARNYELLIQMDADLSHQAEELPILLQASNDKDLVIGSRYIAGGAIKNWSWSRRLLSRAGTFYARSILNLAARDLTSGYNVWRAGLLAKMDLDSVKSTGYSFQIEMKQRALELGATYQEVPITFIERQLGKSKIDRAIILEAIWRTWLIRVRSRAWSRYKRFIKYSLVGLTGLAIDMLIMIALVELAAWSPLKATLFSFAFSSLNTFIWNKRWTFRNKSRDYLRQYGQFLLAALFGLAINYVVMASLLAQHLNYILARLLAIGIVVLWNFFINSLWTFRPIKTDLSTEYLED